MPQGSHKRPTPQDLGPAVVVGAGGFLGGALLTALRKSGIPSTGLTVSDPALREDASLHPATLTATTVYWAASTINPLVAQEHPERVEADLTQLGGFLDAIHAANPGVRIVLLSSGGTVYGDRPPPHSEYHPLTPVTDYGRAKAAAESLLRAHEIGSVVVRIANAYGPGQPAAPGQGVVGHWLRAIRAGEPVTIFGDLGAVRDYVYVSDITALLVALHNAPGVPPVVNVGSGVPTSLADLIDVIHDVVPDRRLTVVTQPRRSFDIPASWLDVSVARDRLGWQASTSLHDGVAATWAWLSRVDH